MKKERNMKILVLDDSSVLCRRLRAALSDRPDIEFVDGNGDPLDAIRLVKEMRPDAVIVDMLARRRFGIDVPRNIKKIVPAPLVVMLTNKFYPDSEEEYVKDKVDFHFDKFTELDKVSTIFTQTHRRAVAAAGI